jgi:hypothetical protein
LSLALIAAVYIGFAVADGRPMVVAVECAVAGAFVVLAAVVITGPAWLLVIGFAGHGLKDLWQHRTHFCSQHTVVAPVLHDNRLGRRRHHRRGDRRGRHLPSIVLRDLGNTPAWSPCRPSRSSPATW